MHKFTEVPDHYLTNLCGKSAINQVDSHLRRRILLREFKQIDIFNISTAVDENIRTKFNDRDDVPF